MTIVVFLFFFFLLDLMLALTSFKHNDITNSDFIFLVFIQSILLFLFGALHKYFCFNPLRCKDVCCFKCQQGLNAILGKIGFCTGRERIIGTENKQFLCQGCQTYFAASSWLEFCLTPDGIFFFFDVLEQSRSLIPSGFAQTPYMMNFPAHVSVHSVENYALSFFLLYKEHDSFFEKINTHVR